MDKRGDSIVGVEGGELGASGRTVGNRRELQSEGRSDADEDDVDPQQERGAVHVQGHRSDVTHQLIRANTQLISSLISSLLFFLHQLIVLIFLVVQPPPSRHHHCVFIYLHPSTYRCHYYEAFQAKPKYQR